MLPHKQLMTYKFIVQRLLAGGSAPTYREIADHGGLRSVGTAYSRVKAISQRGLLHQTKDGIRLPWRVGAERGAFVCDYSNQGQGYWPRLIRVEHSG